VLNVAIRKQLEGFTLGGEMGYDAPIVALVGPSGAGKTLTLQCIAGLETPMTATSPVPASRCSTAGGTRICVRKRAASATCSRGTRCFRT
jgi:ABC-type molybdate transport system ATPase subunit